MGYHQILVPMDGKLISEYVLVEVERLAHALDSQVTLLPPAQTHGEGGSGRENGDFSGNHHPRNNVHGYLETIQRSLEPRGVKVRRSFRFGTPAEEIAWYAKEHDTNMVIMSTHGGWNGDATSVAAQVLEKVSVPVTMLKVPQGVASL